MNAIVSRLFVLLNHCRWLAIASFIMDLSLILLGGHWLSTILHCLLAGLFQRILTC